MRKFRICLCLVSSFRDMYIKHRGQVILITNDNLDSSSPWQMDVNNLCIRYNIKAFIMNMTDFSQVNYNNFFGENFYNEAIIIGFKGVHDRCSIFDLTKLSKLFELAVHITKNGPQISGIENSESKNEVSIDQRQTSTSASKNATNSSENEQKSDSKTYTTTIDEPNRITPIYDLINLDDIDNLIEFSKFSPQSSGCNIKCSTQDDEVLPQTQNIIKPSQHILTTLQKESLNCNQTQFPSEYKHQQTPSLPYYTQVFKKHNSPSHSSSQHSSSYYPLTSSPSTSFQNELSYYATNTFHSSQLLSNEQNFQRTPLNPDSLISSSCNKNFTHIGTQQYKRLQQNHVMYSPYIQHSSTSIHNRHMQSIPLQSSIKSIASPKQTNLGKDFKNISSNPASSYIKIKSISHSTTSAASDYKPNPIIKIPQITPFLKNKDFSTGHKVTQSSTSYIMSIPAVVKSRHHSRSPHLHTHMQPQQRVAPYNLCQRLLNRNNKYHH